MDGEIVPVHRRTVEDVFRDFRGRRSGLLKALITDVDEFVRQCDPGKDNLCLYGYPDETWEVNLPVEEVPPELPEPVLGINFARDGMDQKDWLSLVAVHSDAWLLAVAFFFAAKFDKNERKKLFGLIIDQPTLYDVVLGRGTREVLSIVQQSGNCHQQPNSGLERSSKRCHGHHHLQVRKMTQIMRMNMSMRAPCVVSVERTMVRMSSGYAVMFVSSGFMASVSRLHQPRLKP